MNILQILPSLDVGGVETGTIDLARYLVSKGHKAITVSAGGRLVRELDAIGARHYNLPVNRKSIFSIIRMIGAVREVIRKEDIDIVHVRSRVPALIAYFACRATGRVFITTAHGYYGKHLLSKVMSWGKFVIVASNIMARHMKENFHVPLERIRLIPRGVDLGRFVFYGPRRRKAGTFVVGMISRITPLKGHADFIKACAILYRSVPRLKVLIVGSAPRLKYIEELKLLTRRLGLEKVIEFIPSRPDVPEVLKGFDVLVSATLTPEAFGRSIIEAQACGTCVVATKVGGVVDIVEDGRTGLLCAAQNPKEMAACMMRIYEDDALAGRLSAEGRKSVEEKYNLGLMMERTMAVYEEALKTQNILVIKMSALGDVILSVPSLRAIRSRFPDAKIKVLVAISAQMALENCPYINERIVCDFEGRHKGLSGMLRLARELAGNCFEVVFDLQNNKRSHLLAFLSMALIRYGYDNGKLSIFLNRKVKDDAPYLDPVEHQFRVLRAAGVKDSDKRLELWPSKSNEEEAQKLLSDNWVKPSQSLVGINVRASSRWQSKNWPPDYIAQLCDMLARDCGVRVVLTGSAADTDYASSIAASTRSKPIVAAGRTDIMTLAALIKRFRVYLTPDSAPMHVACAVGTPIVALFGPTDPRRHLSPVKNSVTLCRSFELRCGPCYRARCGKNYKCMKRILADDVFSAMKPYLSCREAEL